ncbi:MAG: hypothetical protein ACLPKI_22420 [Streptosporangiaceae bacterium]
MHAVVALALPAVEAFDLAIAAQVFADPGRRSAMTSPGRQAQWLERPVPPGYRRQPAPAPGPRCRHHAHVLPGRVPGHQAAGSPGRHQAESVRQRAVGPLVTRLGVRLGEALLQRNIGGRITPAVIQDIAYAGYLVDTKAPQGPYFEVAVIHHTDCGSTLLADDELRHGFAERIGADERTLADTPVLDPARTVRTDVERVLWAAEIPQNIRVSGHVYDVQTGLVTTIVDAKSRK